MDKTKNITKVLAYIRYSCHAQDDGNSVSAQISCIDEYAKAHDMEIEKYYIDMARSGRNTNRPQYQQLKQDIESKAVEAKIILVRAIDRMHRNTKNQLEDVEWCGKNGVRIIGITDGTDTASESSTLLLTVKAAVAQEYSDTLRINTRAALLECAKQCKHLGGIPPLGYKVNKDGTYEIDESTAPIICDIYKLYLQGMGYSYIIRYLKKKNYKTAKLMIILFPIKLSTILMTSIFLLIIKMLVLLKP